MADLSTESITGATEPGNDAAERCGNCGSPLAADQRYCLECGERRAPVSEFLRGGPPRAASPPPRPPGALPPGAGPEAPAPRGGAVTLLAGIGVLLLAMGVGVLIGRSGSGSSKTPAPEVVTIGSSATGTAPAATEETFTSDWPSGKKGWTVELQTLPESSTPAQVTAAKTAATGKGATAVGALKSEELASGGAAEGFVVYSGEYTSQGQAQKALGGLKRNFPAAKAVQVSSAGGSEAGSSGRANNSGGSKPAVKSSLKKPAPAATLKGHGHSSGKKYEEESAKLPNVVETG